MNPTKPLTQSLTADDWIGLTSFLFVVSIVVALAVR